MRFPADPVPDPAVTRPMLVAIVDYVNSTVRQLPNLMASRFTNGFEDRPQSETLTDTGIESLGYLPLHWVGSLSVGVTYRDRKEVEDSQGEDKEGGIGRGRPGHDGRVRAHPVHGSGGRAEGKNHLGALGKKRGRHAGRLPLRGSRRQVELRCAVLLHH